MAGLSTNSVHDVVAAATQLARLGRRRRRIEPGDPRCRGVDPGRDGAPVMLAPTQAPCCAHRVGAPGDDGSPLDVSSALRGLPLDDDQDPGAPAMSCTVEFEAAYRSLSFVILLKGPYQPVVHGPDLGLSTVDLNDGSYSTTKIFPIIGATGRANLRKAIGNFFVQFAGDLCAYDLPGGSIAMRFTSVDFTEFIPDGLGGQFMDGTAELTIPEATGKFRRFVGGHNLMVDRLHALAPGDGSGGFNEYCFCFVSHHERENGRERDGGPTTITLERAMRRAGPGV
jgi:hypothetical protein